MPGHPGRPWESPVSENALTVAGTRVRRDAAGRYCLNDLHRAAGGESRHQPAFFARRKETAELIAELGASADSQTPLATVNDGLDNGTYAAKELVYAYAMWISPAFHLKVIRAYDALLTAPPSVDPSKLTRADLARLVLDAEAEIAQLQHQVSEAAPKVAALERIAEASTGSTCITTAAKALGQPPRALFAWLQQNVWIYRRSGSAAWCAYQHRLAAGLLEHKVTTVTRPDGTEKVVHQVLVTPKGLAKLGEAFGRKAVAA